MGEAFGCYDLIDGDDLFFDFDPVVVSESPLAEGFTRSSPDSVNSWIGAIESQSMSDENINEPLNFPEFDQQSVTEFLADLFVEYPTNDLGHIVESTTAQVLEVPVVAGKEHQSSDKSGEEKKSVASNDSGNDNRDGSKVESELDGNDDVVAKKRTRRLRNRDAAVRSRERKKEYVQDLERKSKYLERECMRLGRMLDCFVAENHSLRLYIEKGNGNTSMTKQESAVLLESLLLGSLFWFLGDIICQFPQPRDTMTCLPVEPQEPEKPVLSVPGRSNEQFNIGNTRRCKSSRPRMKHKVLTLVDFCVY